MGKELSLRPVRSDDCRLLFDWVNDPKVRESAFDSDPVGWDEHLQWFRNRLVDSSTKIYIAESNNHPVGQIRFECQEEKATVDVSVKSGSRGRGYGATIIEKGSKRIFALFNSLEILEAWIKSSNEGSRRAFRKAGYRFDREETVREASAFVFTLRRSNRQCQ